MRKKMSFSGRREEEDNLKKTEKGDRKTESHVILGNCLPSRYMLALKLIGIISLSPHTL